MYLDLTGQKFGRLTAIERVEKRKGRTKWVCQCECGNIKEISLTHLRSGATTSCGCLQKEKASEANKKHGGQGTSLYHRWKSIRQRCLNPKNQRYDRYGGRGIIICEAWLNYEHFEKWSVENGYDETLTLDRIDNNGNYEPSNCRWVDYTDNGRNRNITVRVEGKTLGEIAENNNLSYQDIHYRFYFLKSKGVSPTQNDLINYQHGNHEPSS